MLEAAGFADPEVRRKVLSFIVANSSDSNRIRAIAQLEAIESNKGKDICPPEPMTKDQAVSRLSSLMTAVGEEITNEAVKTAFTPKAPKPLAASDSGVA